MAHHGSAPISSNFTELIKQVRATLLDTPGFFAFIQQCYEKQINTDMLQKLLIRTYSPATLRNVLQALFPIIQDLTRQGIPPLGVVTTQLHKQIGIIDDYYKTIIANLFQSVMGKADQEQLLKDIANGRMTIHVNSQTYFGYLQQQQIQQLTDSASKIELISKFYRHHGITDINLLRFLIDHGHQSGVFGFEHPISSCQPPNDLLLRNNDEKLKHTVQQTIYDGMPALQITRVISYRVKNFSNSKTYKNPTNDSRYDEGFDLPHCLSLSITLKCKVYWNSTNAQFAFVDGEYIEDADIHEEHGGLFPTNEVYQYLCQFIAIFFEEAQQIFIGKTLKPDSYASTLSQLIHKKTEHFFNLSLVKTKLSPIIPMISSLYAPGILEIMVSNMRTAAETQGLLETIFIEIVFSKKPIVTTTRIMALKMLINILDQFTIN